MNTAIIKYTTISVLAVAATLLVATQLTYAQSPGGQPPPPDSEREGRPPLPPTEGAEDHMHDEDGNHVEFTSTQELTTEDQQEKISLLQRLVELLKMLLGLQSGETMASDVAQNADRPAGGLGGQSEGGGPGGGGGGGPERSYVDGDAIELEGFTFPESEYYGEYVISDSEFGTEVSVTIDNGVRTIVSNALPNHETGDFPREGNPNEISAQDTTYEFTATPEYTGTASWVNVMGVAINGVKFQPETGEMARCASGETYKYEALQDTVNLGLDFNNAHVQPTGAYHYHGVSELLTDMYKAEDGLTHVGFAADGHYIMYDNTNTITSSYQLVTDVRTGTDCTYRDSDIGDLEGTAPDGTYVSDWEYVSGSGDLDACNGAFVEGQYVYLISDDYPYAGRCVQG